ncbi:hypothetical protein N3K63_10870 [Microbacterium sp. W1N]|uniref:hypothetical protein n=1 Tax=Microbacterium festucae TaxID=2977531 RepID=UPI0021BF5837|nr:hypothetical protein [Microbacterium festucae]MCT9820785.1 hypothetical protein [Microbacterium festucae]
MSTVPASTTAAPAAATFARDWQQWHRDHETRRADAHGFLAITGLHWLGDEAARIPGVPGSWSSGAGGPVAA